MTARLEVRPFTADDLGGAAVLLAQRHQRHREKWPALDVRYEDPVFVAPLITELFFREGASGAMAHAGADPAAFVLGTRRDSTWGAKLWVEDAGSAGRDPEAIRLAYASAAAQWVDEGRVDPAARGLGAGRALADAVLDWSREQGYEWVATDWRSTNLEADRTWRSAGFRPSFLRLHRAIA